MEILKVDDNINGGDPAVDIVIVDTSHKFPRNILQKKTIPTMHAFWKKIIDESLSVRAAEAHAKPVSKTKKIKKLKIQKGQSDQ